MEVISNKYETIFRNENNGKVSYLIGISKKQQDGTYQNGYIPCRFKKEVSLENKTRIKIKQAWIDFYKVEKKTYIYVFINDFEKEQVNEQVSEQEKNKALAQNDIWGSAKDMDIPEEELPFY